MALDGISIYALKNELLNILIGSKIEKVYMPEKDEITMQIHSQSGNFRLIASANANYPRVHLTTSTKENPLKAPLFCMLLRKHIQNGRIIDIKTEGIDRIITFVIEGINELMDIEQKRLVVEIMGRHSNIILIDKENRIIDSIKHIDITQSRQRQVLPNLFYELPPKQGKLSPLTATKNDIEAVFMKDDLKGRVDKHILNSFEGISPLLSREITYLATNYTDIYFEEIKDADLLNLIDKTQNIFDKIKNNLFSPCVLYEKASKKPSDFYIFEILQYGDSFVNQKKPTVSSAIDEYFINKDKEERLTQKKSALFKIISNNLDRCTKKLIIQKNELKDAQNKDIFKLYGDLILANIYKINENQSEVTLENYYTEQLEKITIPLEKGISPSKNVQKYYAKYSKAKKAEIALNNQIEKNIEEIDYLESVFEALKIASSFDEISEIKAELAGSQYIKAVPNDKKKDLPQSLPLEFKSSDGFTIFVGKNNRQNDKLTLKSSKPDDIWFHTKNIPGSHTVIKANGKKNIPERTITEAAMLCAYHSRAKNSSNAPVDYTFIKNVKKPPKAKPGMVIYDSFKTVFVTPDEALVNSLKI